MGVPLYLCLFTCFWGQAGAGCSQSDGEGSTGHLHRAPGVGAEVVAGQGGGCRRSCSCLLLHHVPAPARENAGIQQGRF